MYNYDVSNYMRKFYSPNHATGVPDPEDEEVVNPDITSGTKERKPRTRLSKWLAKIAGVYDGEMEPKTEAEYYLNEITHTYPENADILENAKDLGGIGWTEPDTLFYSGDLFVSESARINPAKLLLIPGETYTFIVKKLATGEEETITSGPAELNPITQAVWVELRPRFYDGAIRISSSLSLNENDISAYKADKPLEGVEIILVGKTHQINQQFLPGVFTVHIDTSNHTLDKTMGEIQEAWNRGDRIDIIDANETDGTAHWAPNMLIEVHFTSKGGVYIGSVSYINPIADVVTYSSHGATEAEALNGYPVMNT
jgi:hypothetical protein